METEEFNKKLSILTDEFLRNWTEIIDIFAQENELGPNHKLCVLLFSHLGLERALSSRVYQYGSNYMDAVVAMGEELGLG